MKERMVVLKSMVNGTVSVNYPQYGINRRWSKMGQPIPVPFTTVEQCLYENGFRRMIDSGILYIENMQDKIELGLEPADASEPENIIVLEEKDMENLLKATTLDTFIEKTQNISRAQMDNLIDYAIRHEIVIMDKANYIKELTGRDILAAVSRKQQVEEADKRAQKKEERNREEGRR